MKTCKECNKKKDLNCYYSRKRKSGNITFDNTCKKCRRDKQKTWSKTNKEKKKESDKKWRENNKERKIKNDKIWRQNNKEKKKETDRKWRENNKEHIKLWREENRQKLRDYQNEWLKIPENKIIDNQRSRLKSALKVKNKSTIEYLQCSSDFLKKWLEWQFDENMSWDNHGTYWHIDHVKPCYEYKTSKDTSIFSWKNLRPLEKTKNLSKNNKIIQKEISLQTEKVIFYMQHLQNAGNSLEL